MTVRRPMPVAQGSRGYGPFSLMPWNGASQSVLCTRPAGPSTFLVHSPVPPSSPAATPIIPNSDRGPAPGVPAVRPARPVTPSSTTPAPECPSGAANAFRNTILRLRSAAQPPLRSESSVVPLLHPKRVRLAYNHHKPQPSPRPADLVSGRGNQKKSHTRRGSRSGLQPRRVAGVESGAAARRRQGQ